MSTREVFEKGAQAFNAHDIDGFSAVLADDVFFEAPGIRGAGKLACSEFYRSWFVAFPDAHVEVHNLYVIDDIAVEEGTFTGTHNGVLRSPRGDIPPTGRPVALDYIQILRFRDGKHASFHLIFDWLLMLEQLDIMPPRGTIRALKDELGSRLPRDWILPGAREEHLGPNEESHTRQECKKPGDNSDRRIEREARRSDGVPTQNTEKDTG